jgi:hypothetical protein
MHILEWPEPDRPQGFPLERTVPVLPAMSPLTVIRRFLARRRARDTAIGDLPAVADGALVRVRGVVRPLGPLRALISGEPAACRRVRFAIQIWPHVHERRLRGGNRLYMHEAAVDFDVVDPASRKSVRIEVARAALRLPWLAFARVDDEAALRLLRLPLGAAIRKNAATAVGMVAASESLLGEGALVEVIGQKHRIAGMPEGERLEREIPTRPALRSPPRGELQIVSLRPRD